MNPKRWELQGILPSHAPGDWVAWIRRHDYTDLAIDLVLPRQQAVELVQKAIEAAPIGDVEYTEL